MLNRPPCILIICMDTVTLDMGTPELPAENFSDSYKEYVRNRVLESPLSIENNRFFPEGTLLLIPKRKQDETEEEWASRCVVIKNVG